MALRDRHFRKKAIRKRNKGISHDRKRLQLYTFCEEDCTYCNFKCKQHL